jgi:hypothetical protein
VLDFPQTPNAAEAGADLAVSSGPSIVPAGSVLDDHALTELSERRAHDTRDEICAAPGANGTMMRMGRVEIRLGDIHT